MAKFVNDSVMDAGLDHVKDNVAELHVVNGDPADRAAVLTNSLEQLASWRRAPRR